TVNVRKHADCSCVHEAAARSRCRFSAEMNHDPDYMKYTEYTEYYIEE
ncbi:hypothetical protein GBF38_015923, partial [Nibea albiflora]